MIILCCHVRGLLFDLRGVVCDKAAKDAWNNDIRAIFLWTWAALLPKNSSLQYRSKIGCFGAKTIFFITFFERVFGRGKLFPKKIGDKCSTGNIVFPENLAFCRLFSWRILQKFLCPYFTSFSRKKSILFYFPSGSYRNAAWCFFSEIFYPLFWIFLFDYSPEVVFWR